MSAKENPCRKFQANIFNKSKCQNCFKPRESHALIDEDLSQAKPVYGGWLLLAPEGTDFDNPVQRSRKWQRRFFILYEHGLLRYALDEMPSTLPQGTINMNQCLDVVDGEKRTSQKNSLCVVTPEKEHFIRAENKEIINGWFDTLIVYPRTNKQNQKKKRKVEPPTPQEPGPAKVAVTSSGASSTILSVEKVPSSKSTLWQEEPRGRSHIPCSRSTPSLCQASVPPAVTTRAPKAESESGSTEHVDGGRKARVESGYFSLEKTKPEAKTPEETLPQPPQHLQYASPSRYSYPDAESPNPCRSPEYSDPFLSPGPFHSNGSSAISSSQSSLDSEASSATQTSGASWESRGAGGGGTQIEKAGACQSSRNTREYATLADIPKAKRISNRDAFQVERKRLEQRTRARSPGREEVVRLFGQERRRSQVIEKFETLDVENAENMETSSAAIAESSISEPQGTSVGSTRLGRSARRAIPLKQDCTLEASKGGSVPEASSLPVSPCRRAKSLDRRTTESSITPDLLNFKKGWMTKLYQDGVWKKHWFVLTDQSLRFYRDSIAEEAADLDGEIDLSTCFDVTEFPVQRNYGFQIHTKDRVFTLSAMTSGIRRNWVQAITKSIRPSTAPDVTSSLPEEKAAAKPSSDARVTAENASQVDGSHAVKKAGARERRRDGRSKTFDWAEFRPTQQLLAQEREPAMAEVAVRPPVGPSAPVEEEPRKNASAVTDLEKERAWRREVRRKRFETADVSFVSSRDDAKFQMEVGRSQAIVLESKSPSVRVEIEERWHQVETTPLREEKQIPISTLHPSASDSESVPPQDLAPLLLEKELEETQKELRGLQDQNRLLQEQLKEAQSREHNAREGYVLQTDATAASQMGAWHRLHKLNQDLQTELDCQRQRQDLTNQQVQTLKQNYGQVKEIIRQRELDIQKLQDKLGNAMAEIDVGEQTIGKMRRELQAERDKLNEQAGEWQHDEEALQSQLKASEARLREVEAMLLEKSQALRDLERQQALQRDYQKEALKLQDRLTRATEQLAAMEEAHALHEERRQKSYEFLKESHEKEQQALSRSLLEAEGKVREFEERLQKAECQREDTQKEKRTATLEYSEIVHHLEEQLLIKNEGIQELTQNVRDLQTEKDQLECKCQELSHQLSEADAEALKLRSRLKTEETDYYNLEHSYEKVSEEIQKVRKVLGEKEDEIREVQVMYERLVEKKERDLNEALVKMAALGTSLEETESKLRAKEELVSHLDGREGKLEAAELRVGELERQLAELRAPGACSELDGGVKSSPPTEAESDPDASAFCKRQRIRFASIYCQKYEGDKSVASSASPDASQDGPAVDKSPLTSTEGDPGRFISIIRSLENKLYVTEEKLKEITQKVEEEQSRQLDSVMEQRSHWAETEHELRQQLDASLSKIDGLKAELQGEMDAHAAVLREARCRVGVAKGICEEALAWMESSREKVQQVLGGRQGVEVGTLHRVLQEADDELVNATKCLKQQGAFLEETTASAVPTEDKVNVLTRMLAFEALLLNKMAASVERCAPDRFGEISQEVGKFENSEQTAAAYADVLTHKLVWERDLWAEGEKVPCEDAERDGESQSGTLEEQMADRAARVARVTSEASLRLQHLKHAYQRQMEEPSGKAKSRRHQGVRGAVGQAGLLADITPPELAPYVEQIQMEEARSLALEVVEKHLGQDGGRVSSVSGERFAAALRREAQLLQPLSRDVESAFPCRSTPPMFAWDSSSADALCRSSSVLVREAVVQAQIAYVACKLRVQRDEDAYGSMEVLCQEHVKNIASIQERYDKALLAERCAFEAALARLKEENEALRAEASQHLAEISRQQQKLLDVEELRRQCRSELQEAQRKQAVGEAESQRRLEEMRGDVERAEERHTQDIRTLEDDLHRRILELQKIHEEEMRRLHGHYTQTIAALQQSLERQRAEQLRSPPPEVSRRPSCDEERDLDAMAVLKERILELETQRDVMKGELVEHKHLEGDLIGLRDRYQKDFEKLKATCERGFAAMEETHQKVIGDIQRQHQRELDKLLEEKERLLAEETAATIAAIEAMKNAHRVELEKSQRCQITGMSADIEELRRQYQEELQSLYRELEVLSEQYSQKCLENAHLAQALEAERQALQQCQRENQELNAHNQELNTRLAAEITRLRSCITGEGGDVPLTQGKDAYELEVLLRVKESEIQYLKQEIHSLKDELQTALKDKKYATDKYKDIYTELSIVKAKADCDISKLKEQLVIATEAVGDTAGGGGAMSGYDIMKSKSNPDFLKKERASVSRQTRSSRSKSLKEGLTVQERLKLFEAMDSKKV